MESVQQLLSSREHNMSKIPPWNVVIEAMSSSEKKDFMKWWQGLPKFSHAFDMQAIVALSFKAGRESNDTKRVSK